MPPAEEEAEEQDEPLLPPAALLVRHIPSAAVRSRSVQPDETLEKAQALMSANDFSQLPVLAGPRDLKGAVSWRPSPGRPRQDADHAGGRHGARATGPCNDELLNQIERHLQGRLRLRAGTRTTDICGIVTSADLTDQFRDLTTRSSSLARSRGGCAGASTGSSAQTNYEP